MHMTTHGAMMTGQFAVYSGVAILSLLASVEIYLAILNTDPVAVVTNEAVGEGSAYWKKCQNIVPSSLMV